MLIFLSYWYIFMVGVVTGILIEEEPGFLGRFLAFLMGVFWPISILMGTILKHKN